MRLSGILETISVFSLVLLLLPGSYAQDDADVPCTYRGDGVTVCRLGVTQDVTLESSTTNYNYLEYLLVGEHEQYPLKRSLLQFQDLPPDTPGCTKLVDAFMYVYFAYAHKPSWHSDDYAPYTEHKVQAHMVLQPWDEAEATSKYRLTGVEWNADYLALDGTDADGDALSGGTWMHISQPSRFVEFKVKSAVKKWFFQSETVDNNGLLLKVVDEDLIGRDRRFFSNAHSDSTKHAYINVICTD